MILVWAIGAGLIIGLGWAKSKRHPYRPPIVNHVWLVIAGFLPQFLIVYIWGTHAALPNWILASCIIVTQLILFIFAWLNRGIPGMLVLTVGLLLNLIVITANHGFMPVSPQTTAKLVGQKDASMLQIGSRFGLKDILLLPQETRFELLADRFLLPEWFPYQVAFSLGDVFIAAGVFWVLANQKSIS